MDDERKPKRRQRRDRKLAEGEQKSTTRQESEATPSTSPTAGASGKQGESQKRGRFPALRGVEPKPDDTESEPDHD